MPDLLQQSLLSGNHIMAGQIRLTEEGLRAHPDATTEVYKLNIVARI